MECERTGVEGSSGAIGVVATESCFKLPRSRGVTAAAALSWSAAAEPCGRQSPASHMRMLLLGMFNSYASSGSAASAPSAAPWLTGELGADGCSAFGILECPAGAGQTLNTWLVEDVVAAVPSVAAAGTLLVVVRYCTVADS